jgi:hypothetical protein
VSATEQAVHPGPLLMERDVVMSETKNNNKAFAAGILGALMVLTPVAVSPTAHASAGVGDPTFQTKYSGKFAIAMRNLLPSHDYLGWCTLDVPGRPDFEQQRVDIGTGDGDFGNTGFFGIKLDPEPQGDGPEMLVDCWTVPNHGGPRYHLTLPNKPMVKYHSTVNGAMKWDQW